MKTQAPPKSTYQIEGKFLGFIPKPGDEFKHMQIQTGERIISIKLAKELREKLGRKLVQGDRLLIYLEQTGSGLGNQLKLKSDRVEKLNTSNESLDLESSVKTSKLGKKQKGKILICRKSSCSKRGGKQLYRALADTLNQLGLQDRVSIELTGCQKQCKKAPSLILMPGKVKHAYVNPKDLTSLVKAHYLPVSN